MSSYDLVKLIFPLRDPIRTFDSWKKVGWTDLKDLMFCYEIIFKMIQESHGSQVVFHERLGSASEIELRKICSGWDVSYEEAMLKLDYSFNDSILFNSKPREAICAQNLIGGFDAVRKYDDIDGSSLSYGLLMNDEKSQIEDTVGFLYMACLKDDVMLVQNAINKQSWYGFDLDDTLHEFRKASSKAVIGIFQNIESEYSIPIDDLRTAYTEILATTGAFTDGKKSDDYRKERFATLLAKFSCFASHDFLDTLVFEYKRHLEAALELKCGAVNLIRYLKSIGKKIMIITEGPQDAQEWTLEKLGLSNMVDYLATTNSFGISKVDGLFSKVLAKVGIKATDLVFVGDSEARDVIPARAEGVTVIHYSERENLSLDVVNLKVNTLSKIQHILML